MAKSIIKKNAQGYGYNYTDLAAINGYIESIHGKYWQATKTDASDGCCYIVTHRYADDIIPEDIEVRGAKVVEATLSNGKQNPAQANGSATTYARRYSLQMAYGLATTDNDAEDLTIPDGYQQPERSYRDKLIEYASIHGVALADVAEQYGLKPKDSEAHYKAALEQMQRDIEG